MAILEFHRGNSRIKYHGEGILINNGKPIRFYY